MAFYKENNLKKIKSPILISILHKFPQTAKFFIIDDDAYNIKALQIMFADTKIIINGRVTV